MAGEGRHQMWELSIGEGNERVPKDAFRPQTAVAGCVIDAQGAGEALYCLENTAKRKEQHRKELHSISSSGE